MVPALLNVMVQLYHFIDLLAGEGGASTWEC